MLYFSFFLKWKHQDNSSSMDGFMQINTLKKKFPVPPWNFKVVPS